MTRNQMINRSCELIGNNEYKCSLLIKNGIIEGDDTPYFTHHTYSELSKRNKKYIQDRLITNNFTVGHIWGYTETHPLNFTPYNYVFKIGYILHCLCSDNDLEQILWELN